MYQGLITKVVKNYEKIENLLNIASEIWSTGETNINEFSSWSHLILTVNVSSVNHELGRKF